MYTAQLSQEAMRLRVDFNDVAPGNRLRASLRFSSTSRRPEVGEVVRLWDGEGNECWAVVAQIENLIVIVAPQWETWDATPPAPIAPTSFCRQYTARAPRTRASFAADENLALA